jgi:hypothetical protein
MTTKTRTRKTRKTRRTTETDRFVRENREDGADYFDSSYTDTIRRLPDDNEYAFEDARIELAVRITRIICNPKCGYDADKIDPIDAADRIIGWNIKQCEKAAKADAKAEPVVVVQHASWAEHEELAARLIADGTFRRIADETGGNRPKDTDEETLEWITAVQEEMAVYLIGEAKHYDVSILVNMIFKLEMGESTAMPKFTKFETKQFGDLTTWLWYQRHPDFPRDKMGHTSDVCRSIANKVIAFLKTLPEAMPVEDSE